MKVKTATQKDLEEIKSLLQISNLPTTDLVDDKQKFWIAYEEEQIRAVGGLEIYGSLGLLRSMAVVQEERNKGLGTVIYDHIISMAEKELGIKILFLLTTTAASFFEKKGWQVISREAVPKVIRETEEFASVCPSNATCMMLPIGHNKAETAHNIFAGDFNCSQSVLTAFAEDFSLEEASALKIATGFGAGIASKGGICGAVSGAYMALGMKYGRYKAEDTEAKATTYRMIHEFDRLFTEAHGSLQCSQLLNGDVSKEEDREMIMEAGLFKKSCPVFVANAARIVEELED